MIKTNGIENAERLQDAFQLFNQLSRNLTDSYHELENQVARLKDELAAARNERLRTLTEKERLANRLRQLLEALPGGVIVVDGEGRVVEKNAVASKLLGEPLLGISWGEIAERCFWPGTDNPHERCLKNGGFVSISLSGCEKTVASDPSPIREAQSYGPHPDPLPQGEGDQRVARATLSIGRVRRASQDRIRGAQQVCSQPLSSTGEEAGQIILLTDVSEMRALQELVNQHKRLTAMGEMVAAMAHQVRTPLSAAVLYASHLGKAGLGEDHRLRFAQKLQERLRHLERQVNDMLIFARGGRIEMAAFPLDRLLKKVADSMEAFSPMDTLRFEIVDRTSLESVTGNEDALLGILMNLLTNSVEAMNDRGALLLTVTQPGPDVVRFSVADDGPGISDAHRERIFEPFFTTRSNGTGLGLAVVEAVVRAHGGSVQCESSPCRSTVFHVTLPLRHCDAPLPGGFSGGQHETRSNRL